MTKSNFNHGMSFVDWLGTLDREDLYCAGLHPPDDWVPISDLPEPKPLRKPRKPSTATAIKQIEKDTGKTVTGVTVAADGTRTFTLNGGTQVEPQTSPDDELKRWRKKHAR